MYLRCVSKDTNAQTLWIKSLLTLVMPVEQNGEIKLILQCDYTKTFFVFITSSLQNKASTYEYAAEATVTLAQIKLCNFVV